MTDYAKHIQALQVWRMQARTDFDVAAFDAAIKLMQSAQPKSEAEERKVCADTAFVFAIERKRGVSDEEFIARTRAEARAEGWQIGYARGFAHFNMSDRERCYARSEAEIERLRADNADLTRELALGLGIVNELRVEADRLRADNVDMARRLGEWK